MTKKTLVIGASTKGNRYSNVAIKRLVQNGHQTVAIGLREGIVAEVDIQTGFPDFDAIDTVTLYINPDRQQQYYDYILGLHPNRIIFNPGTENPEFYQLLHDASIKVEVACTLVLLSTDQY